MADMIVLLVLLYVAITCADFVYECFNETTGLLFNGAASTSSCKDDAQFRYGDVQGKGDIFNVKSAIERRETADLVYESAIETSQPKFDFEIKETLASFLHRPDTVQAPDSCKNIRARLTPSQQSKAGSFWYRDNVPVINGFDTYFTFQITDHSKECTFVKDQYLSHSSYRSCSVHGGDGFAFAIQASKNNTAALGGNGQHMGFGGIDNSIAIAFDTWQNPGEDMLGVDHISVHSRGHGINDALQASLIGRPRSYSIADGAVHLARVVYYGYLVPKYFDRLVASDSLLPYLKDNGEQKRIGTLVIFMDEGVANDTPLFAMPINLSLLLNTPDDKAFIGFTGSTGRYYEKHDILSWVWCDQEPCDASLKSGFDYHQTSAFSSAGRRHFIPGTGFGGIQDQTGRFPIRNQDPDTTAWSEPKKYFAAGRSGSGLHDESAQQMPPNTLY